MVCALALTAGVATAAEGQARRVQIFSESFSLANHGPYFVRLDSGVTYRLAVEGGSTGDVSISPRASGGAPIRFSTSSNLAGGLPFESPATGEFKVESNVSGSTILQVRLFREMRDAAECANPSAPGCAAIVLDEPSHHRRLSPAVIIMAALFPAFLYGVFRNGRSF